VYRTGQAIETLQVEAPTDADHADVCIDRAGLVLEEVAVVAGKLSFREVALEVDDAASLGDDVFAIQGDPLPLGQGGSELRPLDPSAAPTAGYWQFATAPPGFEHRGRYVLREPAPESSSTTTAPGTTSAPLESYVDVYVNGPTMLVVHQGPSAAEPTRDTTRAPALDAGGLGSGHLLAGLVGSTLVTEPRTGWFVEITATLPSTTIGELAVTLQSI
jgi:hypothetical protein